MTKNISSADTKVHRRLTLCLHSVHWSCAACRPWKGCGVISGLSFIAANREVSSSSESKQAANPSDREEVDGLVVSKFTSDRKNSWLSCCSNGLSHLGWCMWSINEATVASLESEDEDDFPLIVCIRSRRIGASRFFFDCSSSHRWNIGDAARHWTIALAKQLLP